MRKYPALWIAVLLLSSLTGSSAAAALSEGVDARQVQAPPAQPDPQPLADPAASVSLSVPGQVPIGQDVSFSVTFDNTGPDPGYGPIIDLILDTTGSDAGASGGPFDGLGTTTISASYLSIPFQTSGSGQNMWVLTFDGSGNATHPLMRDGTGAYITVSGTPGDTLVVLRLPFGSFTPAQPPATVDVTVNMSNYADINQALSIQARGGFEFGATPLDDWCCGDEGSLTLSGWVSQIMTPTLLTLSKAYSGPEDEAASGPNFRSFYPMEYTVTVDIAPGQSLTSFVLNDILPNNLQYYDLIGSSPAGASCAEPTNPPPPPESPGGTLICSWPVATPVSLSASLSFNFYIPLADSGGTRVINAASGNDVTSCNDASASYDWVPLDPRDLLDDGGPGSVTPTGCEHTLTDKSIAIQKEVSNLTGGNSAGDTLEYTLRFQVSDFFAFNNLVITDIISDGQHVDPGFTPTLQIEGNPYSWPVTAMLSTPLTQPVNWTYDVDCDYSGSPGPECSTDSSSSPNTGTTTLTFRVSQEIIQRLLDATGRMVGGCVDPVAGSATPNCGTYNNAATYAILRFRTVILDNFIDVFPSGDTSVDQGDVLDNSVSIIGDLLNTSTFVPTGSNELDGSGASLSIGTGALSKSIYAINDNTGFSTPVEVKPGDKVTYRIIYTLPLSDEENLELTDYLPLPIFHVGDPDEDGSAGPAWTFDPTVSITSPAAGEAKFGPTDTFYAYTCAGVGNPAGCLEPTLTSDLANNSLNFYYGDYNDPRHQATTVDLLFSVIVSDDPFADRLYLTNQVNGTEGSTNAGTVAADDIIQIVLTEPVLLSNKGVVWTSNPNALPDPLAALPVVFNNPSSSPRWSGTINASYLAANPIDSNVSFVDAGDTVTFAIVIQNTGSSLNGAFDIIIKDDLPGQFQIPTTATGLNLDIRYGDGTGGITFTPQGGGPVGLLDGSDDLFGNGLELDDPGTGVGVCQSHDPLFTNDIILITFDLQLRDNVTPGTIINTETLVNYAGSEGGPNHLPQPQTDTAETTVTPRTTKDLLSSEIENADNARDAGVIGEFVTYRITLDIPEGNMPGAQLVDTLDPGLAFVQLDSVTTSANVSHTVIDLGTSPTNPVISNANGGDGNRLTFDLGNMTNTNLDDPVETIVIEYTAVVVNVAGNQDGSLINNSAVLSWTSGSLPAVGAPNLTVIEPKLLVSKVPAPSQGDAGDTITFTITVQHDAETTIDPGVSHADAFDLVLSDALPTGMTYAGSGLDCTGGTLNPDSCAFTGNTLDAAWTQATGFPLGSTSVFTFDVTLDASVSPGQVITNTANLTWTSLPGPVSSPRSIHNTNSVERTGTGGVNDYIASGSGPVTITGIPTKSIVSTSESHTGFVSGFERVVIGEIIRYRLVYQIAEGTALNFRLQDLIALSQVGLSFINDGTAMAALVSNDIGMSSSDFPAASYPSLYVPGNEGNVGSIVPTFVLPASAISSSSTDRNQDTYNSGSDVFFWFGDLLNNDRDGDQEFVIVEFNALVDNITQNQAYNNATGGASTITRGNQFQSLLGPGAGTAGSPSSIVDVRVSEPLITNLTKSIFIFPSDAGDTVEYRFTFTNSSSGVRAAAAFDLVLSDTLDANLINPSIQLVSVTGGNCGAVAPTFIGSVVGQDITGMLSCLNAGGTAVVRVSATVANDAPIAGTINNSVDLTYTSLPGTNGTSGNPTGSTTPGTPGSAAGERTGENGVGALNDYVDSDNVSFTLIDPAITKSVFDTSLLTTGSSQHTPVIEDLVIGETVTFHITVTLPEGSAPLTITDNLPTVPPDQGILSVVSSQVIAIGADISGSVLSVGDPGVVSNTDGDSYDDRVVFNFGTLLNTPDGVQDTEDQITVEVVALVENDGNNQDGDTLVNDAVVDYGTGTETASASVEIIVIDLAVTKDDSLSIISPAEVLTYVIDYSNVGTADAFGVTITETVPDGTTFSGPAAWSCPSGSTAGTSCSYSVGDLLIGGSGSVNFIVVVNDPAGVTSVVNTVTIGDDGTQGPDFDTSNNSDTDTDNLATLPDANLTKTFTGAAQPFTSDPEVAIGEIITYSVTLIVPEGTAPASFLTDTLERGLAFVSCDSTSVTGNLVTNRSGGFPAACASPVIAEEPAGSTAPVDEGRRVTFDLGDLTSTKAQPSDPDPTLTITYRAAVLDSAANLRGVSLTNSARWTWNGGDLQQSASPATIVEPTLTLAKSADPRVATLGAPITLTLTVGHAGSSNTNAYDLVLEDILPPEMLFAGGLASTAGVAPTTLSEAAGTITATWDDFPLGTTSTIEFQVTLDNLLPGQRVANEASLEWTSLPDDFASPPVSLSPHNDLAVERRYDPTTPVDVYQVLASIEVSTPPLPATGFEPGRLTRLAPAPTTSPYSSLGELQLEIPSLGLLSPIVGVATDDSGWDLTWLWKNVGFLQGTAYPTHAGNTVLTGHAVLPSGLPGPFAKLGELFWGDTVLLHSGDLTYVYEVRERWTILPNDLSVMKHETLDWVTLITCRSYDPASNTYLRRTVLRAVLVEVR